MNEKTPGVKRRAALLIAAMVASFAFSLWHRTRVNYEALDGRFTGNDAYLYYRQSERILEEGQLPKRDMERWLPLGRDQTLLHNLYSYVVAYSYRAARVFFPNLTLHAFSCYAPPALFAMTAALFTAALLSLYGWEAAGLGSLFFVLSPPVAARTSLGFADRDAFCLFLAVLMGALYLWRINASRRRNRIALAAACGFTACVGCLAWEGFGAFALCVLLPKTIIAWRQKERALELYAFCSCLALPLLVLSSSHRFWVVPTEPAHPVGLIAVFPAMLAPSLVFIRQTLRGNQHIRLKLASFLPASLLIGFLIQRALLSGEAAAAFAVPFSDSRLMQSVSELRDMDAEGWKVHFSGLPIIAALGVVGSWLRLLYLYARRLDISASMENSLFATGWVGVWGYLTTGSMRYAVMLAPSIAAVSAVFLVWIGDAIQQKAFSRSIERGDETKPDDKVSKKYRFAAREALRYLYVTLIPMAVLYWGPAGRIVPQSAGIAALRPPRPSIETTEAYRWISENIGSNSSGERPIVAARWGVGSQLNVLADARTIDDQDLWKHYWIYLSSRHLYCAESETEALQFLKTRSADYWFLQLRDLADRPAQSIEWLGSGAEIDRSIGFSRYMWEQGGSEAFDLVFENATNKIFRIHYPPDLTVPPELYEAWTAPDFPDPELRRVWMGGE